MICAFLKEAQSAHAIAGIAVLILVIYTGYMIPLVSMHPWFKWLSYLNPLRYAFESLMANEFHGRVMSCGNVVPRGPGYENVSGVNRVCGFVGSTLGSIEVVGDNYIKLSYDYSWSHAWRNFGLIIVFYVGFYTINCLATTFINPVIGGGDLLLFTRGHIPEKLKNMLLKLMLMMLKVCQTMMENQTFFLETCKLLSSYNWRPTSTFERCSRIC